MAFPAQEQTVRAQQNQYIQWSLCIADHTSPAFSQTRQYSHHLPVQLAATVTVSPWKTVFVIVEDFNLAIREALARLDVTIIIQ